MPLVSPLSRAASRQVRRTGHWPHSDFAAVILSVSSGSGKKISGSTGLYSVLWQTAWSCQVWSPSDRWRAGLIVVVVMRVAPIALRAQGRRRRGALGREVHGAAR